MHRKESLLSILGFTAVESGIIVELDKVNGKRLPTLINEVGPSDEEVLLALGSLRYQDIVYRSVGDMWVLRKSAKEICSSIIDEVF